MREGSKDYKDMCVHQMDSVQDVTRDFIATLLYSVLMGWALVTWKGTLGSRCAHFC